MKIPQSFSEDKVLSDTFEWIFTFRAGPYDWFSTTFYMIDKDGKGENCYYLQITNGASKANDIAKERKNKRTAKIGVFAVAHGVYWEQFEGLLDNIMKYHKDFCDIVEKNEVEVIDFGMIDSSEKAFDTVPKMKAENLDLLFCNMVTYATSSVFAPIIRDVDVPMALVALQPLEAMDYTKACTFM